MFLSRQAKHFRFMNLRAAAFSKIYPSAFEATKDIKSGDSLSVGGFGLCGIPHNLINALVEQKQNNLTVSSNNCGVDDWGLGLMLNQKQIKRM